MRFRRQSLRFSERFPLILTDIDLCHDASVRTSMMKSEDLIRSLKQGNLALYLFFGDEEFLIQEAVDLIVSKVVDPASRDFNFDTVYCKGTSGNEIVNLAQTFPFMAERRLVDRQGDRGAEGRGP